MPEGGLRRCWRIDEGLTRNLCERHWAMDSVTCIDNRNEPAFVKSPQLRSGSSNAIVDLCRADGCSRGWRGKHGLGRLPTSAWAAARIATLVIPGSRHQGGLTASVRV